MWHQPGWTPLPALARFDWDYWCGPLAVFSKWDPQREPGSLTVEKRARTAQGSWQRCDGHAPPKKEKVWAIWMRARMIYTAKMRSLSKS